MMALKPVVYAMPARPIMALPPMMDAHTVAVSTKGPRVLPAT